MASIKSNCYKTPCEMCINGLESKTLFGIKYVCTKNKKLNKNACFYFTCKGKEKAICETCARKEIKE